MFDDNNHTNTWDMILRPGHNTAEPEQPQLDGRTGQDLLPTLQQQVVQGTGAAEEEEKPGCEMSHRSPCSEPLVHVCVCVCHTW